MRRAMDLIHYVVKDGVLETSNERSVSRQVSAKCKQSGLAFLPDFITSTNRCSKAKKKKKKFSSKPPHMPEALSRDPFTISRLRVT